MHPELLVRRYHKSQSPSSSCGSAISVNIKTMSDRLVGRYQSGRSPITSHFSRLPAAVLYMLDSGSVSSVNREPFSRATAAVLIPEANQRPMAAQPM
jgi:hypothetical protein